MPERTALQPEARHPLDAGLLLGCCIAAGLLLSVLAANASAAPPRPVTELQAHDRPNDRGNGIRLTWSLSPDDTKDVKTTGVLRYEVYRREVTPKAANFEVVGSSPYSVTEYTDASVAANRPYEFQVVAVSPAGELSAAVQTPAITPTVDWFNTDKGWYAVLLAFVCSAVMVNIFLARSGRKLWLRSIPALKAVDEAVGRATEMGRPCLFIPGIVDIDEMPTIAGLTVLSRVARTVAEYDAQLIVPTARSLSMAAARETVQAAYLAAGRPEEYREEMVYYLTDEQFGFASAVAGTISRDRPAACFYFGQFYAESLFLAETGQTVDAIQIAGTNETSQLPFFVAACDYTLIGEEFFAASAYLSGEPQQLGSIKGQDVGKLLAAALILVGALLATASASDIGFVKGMHAYLVETILG